MITTLLFATVMQATLLDHAVAQWKQTPEMRIKDAYKWLFHATSGGEHAIQDIQNARKWLDDEWATLGPPIRGEREIVPLTPDGRLVRVNLRPYKARGGDKELLFAAFVLSAEKFKPDKSAFKRVWDDLGAKLQIGAISSLRFEDWKRLDQELRAAGIGAIHHSKEYEAKHKPAYRVILRDTLY